MTGYVHKRVPKKYGEFDSWFEAIDHYMDKYKCEWKWTEHHIHITGRKDITIEFEGHKSGEWDITKAGTLIIEALKKRTKK